jgi:hypothetical protein
MKHRHYGEPLVIAVIAASGVVGWVPIPKGIWESIVTWVSMAALTGAFILRDAHAKGDLCETCITHMPLDMERAVQRNKGWLWTNHLFFDRSLWRLIWLGVMIGLIGVSLLVHGILRNALMTGVDVLLIVELMAIYVHRRLYPWCPWCRHGGRDDRVEAPTPPVPVNA